MSPNSQIKKLNKRRILVKLPENQFYALVGLRLKSVHLRQVSGINYLLIIIKMSTIVERIEK